MADEGTLGLARASDHSEELSKAELQRRMDEARDSISQTVTEIKDTVVHQYEAVKETINETLDWREQFKKRPVTWSVGAAGAGFLVGYGIAAVVKGEPDRYCEHDYVPSEPHAYAAGPIVGEIIRSSPKVRVKDDLEDEDAGPGLLERVQETEAFGRLRKEAGTIGNRLVDEVARTAAAVVLPVAVSWVKHWLEGLVPEPPKSTDGNQAARSSGSKPSSYQPRLERSQ